MPRWEPDARERLVVAALHLFNEQGYDETTVAQIVERAGLTRSTFFRHFPDKRDVLAAGQETLSRLLVEGIASAPDDAGPLDAVQAGLLSAAQAMGPANRAFGPQLQAVIAASAELQQRDQLKRVGLAAAAADALRTRGVDRRTADLAAELGMLAFKEAYATWVAADDEQDFGTLATEALEELRVAAATLG
ncbi:TetR family transcriptional regulator [Luteimicrobium album]|uniref:TetR family transcriptional regulator n=1 Tax=Luteimicrobium album TaxID=1054550 RepID=A0ABQ6I469_9MICO|nr:TetR/AcrR family transcriptional regulator [Luteimicrobium album]GMA24948.1 TetR family transcriptional regulator [Luteimicrobium album]